MRSINNIAALLLLLAACALSHAIAEEVVVENALVADVAVFMAGGKAPPADAPKNSESSPSQTNPSAPTGPMLYLTDGDYFAGALQPSAAKNVLRWLAQGAAEPFEFNVDSIRSAYFAAPEKRPAPDGDYYLELSDGDVLFGSIAAITKDVVELNSAQFGHLKIARSEVHRLTPAPAAASVYRGPNGLAEWTIDGPPVAKNQW